ncbi:hypothetical protein TIFTF001_001690 [Ficus carica]|uniref:25S rRNA (uridine-N(3))-methyltransferase BMT5-like domain-containing protein n=1 Tax=Ficus carica TaxID=3494 RepID=A0AA87Z0H3_FICCA|nr:hypothetical protein TIFTF001_001690 [Ficus carica]
MTMATKEMRIQHYSSFQKILLVGEGDFSFSACLARAFGSAVNMVATSLDSEETLLTKHWTCEENLDDLEERGCLVLHEVDVHNMNKHPNLIGMKFDVIIFNFPHAGHFPWLCERDAILIKKHKRLLRAFFRSASGMVKEDGEVHVTHRDDYPYNRWEVEKQAQKAGLVLKEKVPFVKQNYPGYHNKRGSFINGNKRFPIEDPFTFKFSLDRHRTTCHTSNAVSGYDHSNLRDSVIQSIKNKVITLEVEHFLSTSSLDHPETTPTSFNSTDKSFTLKDSRFSLDHQETTLRRTSNENVPLKGSSPPKPFSPNRYQQVSIVTKVSLPRTQGSLLIIKKRH